MDDRVEDPRGRCQTMGVTTDATNTALGDLAAAAGKLQQAAGAAAERLAVEAAEREDDIALATVLGERKRDLIEEQLIDFDDMARRVDVDLNTLP